MESPKDSSNLWFGLRFLNHFSVSASSASGAALYDGVAREAPEWRIEKFAPRAPISYSSRWRIEKLAPRPGKGITIGAWVMDYEIGAWVKDWKIGSWVNDREIGKELRNWRPVKDREIGTWVKTLRNFCLSEGIRNCRLSKGLRNWRLCKLA